MLYIVRHGETDWNKERRVQGHTDIPLNDYGRHLARETAEGMKDLHIDLGYTSPLLRAKETAEIILGGRDVPLWEDERIKEVGFGDYEGMYIGGENKDPRSGEFSRFFSDIGAYVPLGDGESVEKVMERTGEFLREICSDPALREKNILISTHGAAMTALLNHVKENFAKETFWKNEVPPNCAVTMVEICNGKPRITRENVIYYKEKVRKWKAV